MVEPDVPELVFKESCQYCRSAAQAVRFFDVLGVVRTTPIESERGEALIRDHHDGELVMAPHLFGDELVYYGVNNSIRGLFTEVPRRLLRGQSSSTGTAESRP